MKNKYTDLKKDFEHTVSELAGITGWSQEQSQKVLELLTDFSAKKAGQEVEKSRVQRKYAKVESTRTLLKNYRRLKLSIECGTEHTLMLLADAEYQRLMEMEESVHNRRLRSTAMLTAGNRVLWTRINAALECFKEMCEHDPSPRVQRQYDLIYEKYIAEPERSVEDILEKMCIEQAQMYRDLRDATSTLSVILFGVDSPDDFTDGSGHEV